MFSLFFFDLHILGRVLDQSNKKKNFVCIPLTITEHDDNFDSLVLLQNNSAENTPESSGNISLTVNLKRFSIFSRKKSGFSGISLPLRSQVTSNESLPDTSHSSTSGSPSVKFWLLICLRKLAFDCAFFTDEDEEDEEEDDDETVVLDEETVDEEVIDELDDDLYEDSSVFKFNKILLTF